MSTVALLSRILLGEGGGSMTRTTDSVTGGGADVGLLIGTLLGGTAALVGALAALITALRKKPDDNHDFEQKIIQLLLDARRESGSSPLPNPTPLKPDAV